MHLVKGNVKVLSLDVFLLISLNLYVRHITQLIVGNPNFYEKIILLPFLLISMSHHRVCKVGFSALVHQEIGKGVDVGIQ